MDPLIPVIAAVIGLAATNGLLTAGIFFLYRSVAAERSAWQHERWELNTRLQASPVSVPLIAPPLPTQRPAETPPSAVAEVPPTELHLVGTIVGNS